MNDNELMKVVEQTAFSVAGMNEQLGLLRSSQTMLSVKQNDLETRFTGFENSFAQYQESQKLKERVEAEEVQEYDDAISKRVVELLKARDRINLYGAFKKKCWCDAKRHSYLRGKAGVDTKKMFHSDVIEYINEWEPYAYGADGYIAHLDSIHKEEST